MRLAIDVREACSSMRTGKGQWCYGFVGEILRRGIPVRLLSDRPPPAHWLAHANVSAAVLSSTGWRWHIHAMREIVRHPDAVYVSPTSYIVPAFASRSVRCIPVVHDMIAFRGEPHDRRATIIERALLGRALRRAAHGCTVSDATRTDLLRRFPHLPPERITPIFAGLPWGTPAQRDPQDGVVLCIGTLCPRKNQLRLIEAFARLPDAVRERSALVLIGGRGWHDDAIVHAARSTPSVKWMEYLSDAACVDALQRCAVFALPSLYEGFGLAVLDALARGIPTLTSDRGSLREVAGEAALVVDPENTLSIRDGLARLLTDASLRTTLARRGMEQARMFSWARTVDLFLGAVASIDNAAQSGER